MAVSDEKSSCLRKINSSVELHMHNHHPYSVKQHSVRAYIQIKISDFEKHLNIDGKKNYSRSFSLQIYGFHKNKLNESRPRVPSNLTIQRIYVYRLEKWIFHLFFFKGWILSCHFNVYSVVLYIILSRDDGYETSSKKI